MLPREYLLAYWGSPGRARVTAGRRPPIPQVLGAASYQVSSTESEKVTIAATGRIGIPTTKG